MVAGKGGFLSPGVEGWLDEKVFAKISTIWDFCEKPNLLFLRKLKYIFAINTKITSFVSTLVGRCPFLIPTILQSLPPPPYTTPNITYSHLGQHLSYIKLYPTLGPGGSKPDFTTLVYRKIKFREFLNFES